MSLSTDGAGEGRRRLALVMLVAVACGAAVLVSFAAWRAHLADTLLRTPADQAASRPELVAFAAHLAEPAYRSHCAACHGANMRGDPSRGVANLVDKDWLYGSGQVSEIEQTITYGIRSGNPKARNLAVMPSFLRAGVGREKITPLSPPEMSDLVAFLFQVENRPADPAAAARGADLYANKAACYDCHTADAAGDQEIGAPNLTDAVWLYGQGTRADIMKAMIWGHAGVCPAWIGRLRPVVIRALAVTLHERAASASRAKGTA